MQTDQYYVPGRDEYNVQHNYHQNLIYGYDTKAKVFYMLGYKNNGHLEKTIISKRGLKRSLQGKRDERAEIIEYQQDSYLYSMQSEYIKEMLIQYLDGTNSSEALQNLAPKVERNYGIQLYNQLNTKNGWDVLIRDRRVLHLLWEHKECMLMRIPYLTEIGIYTKEEGTRIYEQMQRIESVVFNLKNICLKYHTRPDKRNDEKISECLMELREREEKCIREMLNEWNS